MRVTAVTEVRRRNNSVRVSGLLDSRGGYRQPYGNAYGYQGRGPGAMPAKAISPSAATSIIAAR